MDDVFLKIMNLSISASWLILAVLAGCPQKSAEVGHAASLGCGRTAACLPVFD